MGKNSQRGDPLNGLCVRAILFRQQHLLHFRNEAVDAHVIKIDTGSVIGKHDFQVAPAGRDAVCAKACSALAHSVVIKNLRMVEVGVLSRNFGRRIDRVGKIRSHLQACRWGIAVVFVAESRFRNQFDFVKQRICRSTLRSIRRCEIHKLYAHRILGRKKIRRQEQHAFVC